jgi:predicted phage terminase large subunit-like protein
MAEDIPLMDESIALLPQDIQDDLSARGRNDLFFFNHGILGMRDLTEDCHGPLCAYADLNEKQFKLFLMPRDHLKTSNLSIGATLQRVVKDPESRQLLGNESGTNASRFLRSIRQHAEGNRVFRALYGRHIHKDTRKVRWNDSELDFVRQGFYPEPSIDSIGMTGAVTSRHYTHITYDDPISEEAVQSEKVMQDTINRMSASLSLLVNPNVDTIWLVGTRWALHDVYSVWMHIFGNKLGIFARAAVEDGQPIWPERFSLETLALKRMQMGEYKYSCLMMNNPRDVAIQNLNVDDIQYWDWVVEDELIVMYDRQMRALKTVHVDELDITVTVDPAPAEKITSDRNAIVTVGVTPWNEALVLDSWARRCDALEVIEYLFKLFDRWHPRVFGIEDVGYQKVLKVFLRQEMLRRMKYLNLQPIPAQGKKPVRVRGLQPYMATGRVFMHATQQELRQEAADFPLGQHDDLIDALSMHIKLWRGQMSPESRTKYQKSEEAIIRAIRSGHAPLAAKSRIPWDIEEPDDFVGRPPIVEMT